MSRLVFIPFLTVLLSFQSAQAAEPVTSLFPRYERMTTIFADTTITSLTVFPDSLGADSIEAPVINNLFFDGREEIDDEGNVERGESILGDSLVFEYSDFNPYPLPSSKLKPTVFDSFRMLDPLPLDNSMGSYEGLSSYSTEWITRLTDQDALIRQARQRYIIDHPELIIYNEAHLPAPPKRYTATVDPATATILLAEVLPTKNEAEKPVLKATFDRRHWLKKFNADLQFSQAYISPNWYQGGNNNLSSQINLYYYVKLNPAFHDKLLFENTFQYKLGLNNAPEDKVRNYSISADLFQWNMTAGYKSIHNWYYSVNSQFKTQLFNNYKPNSNTLKAAFLSPGEFNVSAGMTYNRSNKKKTFTVDASISPFSYNLKVVSDTRLNVKSYGIEEGHHTVSEYGSSCEGKVSWQICDNISLRSRLFAFTDYSYIQGDFENTISFTINRFLSTQIFVHLRYDSSSPFVEDTEWHKFMMNEILSFGFSYKFASK